MSKKRRRPVGETIGGILVGFDQQIFRDLPPAHEVVEKTPPVRGLAGLGHGLEVIFPGDGPPDSDESTLDEDEPDTPEPTTNDDRPNTGL
ncbi:MAG TPA: hypothetical protein VFN41_15035 [Candidatus Limnocylindrales bacterium]|nr:hypothetical protein [Candidatus Limnocylindrales bacterium]